MVTAIVMIRTDQDAIVEAAQQIVAVDGVREVYSVTGSWDLVAIVEGRRFDDLSHLIPDRIAKVPGLRDTETLVAFRAHSEADLEAGFALGMED